MSTRRYSVEIKLDWNDGNTTWLIATFGENQSAVLEEYFMQDNPWRPARLDDDHVIHLLEEEEST